MATSFRIYTWVDGEGFFRGDYPGKTKREAIDAFKASQCHHPDKRQGIIRAYTPEDLAKLTCIGCNKPEYDQNCKGCGW